MPCAQRNEAAPEPEPGRVRAPPRQDAQGPRTALGRPSAVPRLAATSLVALLPVRVVHIAARVAGPGALGRWAAAPSAHGLHAARHVLRWRNGLVVQLLRRRGPCIDLGARAAALLQAAGLPLRPIDVVASRAHPRTRHEDTLRAGARLRRSTIDLSAGLGAEFRIAGRAVGEVDVPAAEAHPGAIHDLALLSRLSDVVAATTALAAHLLGGGDDLVQAFLNPREVRQARCLQHAHRLEDCLLAGATLRPHLHRLLPLGPSSGGRWRPGVVAAPLVADVPPCEVLVAAPRAGPRPRRATLAHVAVGPVLEVDVATLPADPALAAVAHPRFFQGRGNGWPEGTLNAHAAILRRRRHHGASTLSKGHDARAPSPPCTHPSGSQNRWS
mmetsp:Transcript_18504/g.60110  ORF Transcript_18504/g.60110 Transcript_18504/m.60110 type:complete len:385 (+) Transcript_18504:98-1252(+)